MEFQIFNKIYEFNSFDYIFSKFCLEDEEKEFLSWMECKRAMFFIFGIKIKKKIMKEILSSKFDLEEFNNVIQRVNKNQFRLIYNKIKSNPNITLINDYDLVQNFFENLKKDNHDDNVNIDFTKFKNNLNSKFPLLKCSFINEIFLELDSDGDGYIKISDLEKFLINYDKNITVK